MGKSQGKGPTQGSTTKDLIPSDFNTRSGAPHFQLAIRLLYRGSEINEAKIVHNLHNLHK
jgi:hypothetical protein